MVLTLALALTVFAGVFSVSAAGSIALSFDPASITVGDTASASLSISSVDAPFAAAIFDIAIPDGLVLTGASADNTALAVESNGVDDDGVECWANATRMIVYAKDDNVVGNFASAVITLSFEAVDAAGSYDLVVPDFDAAAQGTTYDVDTLTWTGNESFVIENAQASASLTVENKTSHECVYKAAVTTRPTTENTGVRTYTCECGDSYTEEIPVATVYTRDDGDTYRIGHNLELESSIRIGYLLRPAFVEGAVDYYAVFTKDLYNADGSVNSSLTETVEKDQFAPYVSGGNNRIRVLYSGLLAKEMGTMVRAEIYRELADGTFECVEDSYAISSYATAVLTGTGYTENLKKLVVDLLNYGTAAQNYGNYNTANLVNADFEAYQETYATTEVPEYTSVADRIDNADKLIRLGRALNLGSAVAIVADLKTPDGAMYEDVSNLRGKCVYTDAAGVEQTIWIESEDFTQAQTEPHFYQVSFDGFLAKEMGSAVKISVYDGETQISDTIVYSVESYADFVFKNYASTDTLYIMMEAMLKYGASAKLPLS